MRSIVLLILPTLLLPLAAQADAYKCRLPGGKVEISSTPCSEGSKTLSSHASDAVTPEQREAAEQRLKREREFIRDREAARAAEAARQPPPPPTPPPMPASEPAVTPGTIIVMDPVSSCIASVQSQRMTPVQRESQIARCRNLDRRPDHVHPPRSVVEPVPVPRRPGVPIALEKCQGRKCP